MGGWFKCHLIHMDMGGWCKDHLNSYEHGWSLRQAYECIWTIDGWFNSHMNSCGTCVVGSKSISIRTEMGGWFEINLIFY